ncbi:MAG: peptidoglycan-associated lipoprotein Pal [Rhodoferax sp.]|uniref:peptidoglycan-associated lipoprotein Pal n=1 Tax=Rhodoferax sp. TaxID=50421 RepID=UPI0027306B23|nr:peptidoglycan-associated lipoprotein Pal [Rhodoferax sp.]MDP1529415.1 peptidoglycan-associated lipoprotein Pal [Rhodoferax sp.]MDP2056860.1 peptidoglycan-associated lipoprotein Pal [Thiobacillus sp.]
MNKIFWPALLALTLSACGTTGGTQATVEDRTGGTADTKAATAGPAGGAETTGVGGTGVAGSAMEGSGKYTGDPRKAPASPLSSRSILFDFDSYVVKAEYRPMLEAHAGYLLSKRDARVILQGNADERGSREYNLALGQKRAEAVRRALAVLGVNDAQMEAVSFGEEKPRNEADTDAAYAENRRTDVVYADE